MWEPPAAVPVGSCGSSWRSAAQSGVASGEGQRLRRDGGAWMKVFKTPGRKSRVRTLCEGSRGRVCGIGGETRWSRGKDRARETRRAAGSRPEEAA